MTSERRQAVGPEPGLAGNSLWQLIGVRFKEYIREPEALFWSFGFPILLAIGLGIAFRGKPADIAHAAAGDEPSAGAPGSPGRPTRTRPGTRRP